MIPNNTEDQIKDVEISIDVAKASIAKSDCLGRLHMNKDFKELILQGFFIDEASRVVLMKADHATQKPEDQAQLDKIITAIGGLHQYLNTVYQIGNMSKKALIDHQNTKDELMAESLEAGELQ